MSFLNKIEFWWDEMLHRRRLSLFNTRDNREVWHTHISPFNIVMALTASSLMLFILILTLVCYTPILEYLPGYRTEISQSRQRTIGYIAKLDSMELVINEMMIYADNISLIMDGKSPIAQSNTNNNDRQFSKEITRPNAADSALRHQMESEGRYNFRAASAISSTPIIAPVEGVITERFDLGKGRCGVKIATSFEQRVMAVQDGVVVLSLWSPEVGYTISILHSNNLISIYQNIPLSSVSRGDMVKSGMVIGYNDKESNIKATPSSGQSDTNSESKEIIFELWQNGQPIDPERYIIF